MLLTRIINMSSLRKGALIATLLMIAVCAAVYVLNRGATQDYRIIFDYWSATPQSERPISDSAINKVRENSKEIESVARVFEISPVAIAGIIVAEDSLHTGPVNHFEEYYVRTFFLSKDEQYLEDLADATAKDLADKRLKGESEQEFQFRVKRGLIWSIGLCQISILKARELEPSLADLEGRSRRSTKEIIRALLIPGENLKYCALELSIISKKYRRVAGIDISHRPEILATLYNTGRADQELEEYKEHTGRVPIPNEFGQYVLQHSEQIREALIYPNLNS